MVWMKFGKKLRDFLFFIFLFFFCFSFADKGDDAVAAARSSMQSPVRLQDDQRRGGRLPHVQQGNLYVTRQSWDHKNKCDKNKLKYIDSQFAGWSDKRYQESRRELGGG